MLYVLLNQQSKSQLKLYFSLDAWLHNFIVYLIGIILYLLLYNLMNQDMTTDLILSRSGRTNSLFPVFSCSLTTVILLWTCMVPRCSTRLMMSIVTGWSASSLEFHKTRTRLPGIHNVGYSLSCTLVLQKLTGSKKYKAKMIKLTCIDFQIDCEFLESSRHVLVNILAYALIFIHLYRNSPTDSRVEENGNGQNPNA